VSNAEHSRLVEEMSLHQLRKARELTQTKIAGELHMGQGDVSKLERRTDMYVSTLAGSPGGWRGSGDSGCVPRRARRQNYTVF
jgi:hypothetical protein